MTKRIKAVRINGRVFTHPLWDYHSDILTSAIDALVSEGADREQLIAQIDTRELIIEFGYMGRDEFRTPNYLELMEVADASQS